jgi:hypothetical protein
MVRQRLALAKRLPMLRRPLGVDGARRWNQRGRPNSTKTISDRSPSTTVIAA